MTDSEAARLCDALAALHEVPEEKVWADDNDMAIDHIELGQARAYGWCD